MFFKVFFFEGICLPREFFQGFFQMVSWPKRFYFSMFFSNVFFFVRGFFSKVFFSDAFSFFFSKSTGLFLIEAFLFLKQIDVKKTKVFFLKKKVFFFFRKIQKECFFKAFLTKFFWKKVFFLWRKVFFLKKRLFSRQLFSFWEKNIWGGCFFEEVFNKQGFSVKLDGFR